MLGRDITAGCVVLLNGQTYTVHEILEGCRYRDLLTDKGILTISKSFTYHVKRG